MSARKSTEKTSRIGPDFLCIGARKAGTSWLYDMLARHPDVIMPPVKEMHYFDEAESSCSAHFVARLRNFNEARNRRWRRIAKLSLPKAILLGEFRKVGWLVNYLCSSRTLGPKGFSVYSSFFSSVPATKLTGDVTPYYALLQPDTIALIRSRYPDLKIVYLLRNPFDRAMSALRMYVRDSGLKSSTELSEEYILSVGKQSQHTCYVENLQKWLQYFPPEQVHVDLFDDIKSEPAQLMERICSFLNLSSYSYSSSALSKKVNSSDEIVIDDRHLTQLKAECAQEADDLISILSELPHIDISKVKRWFDASC